MAPCRACSSSCRSRPGTTRRSTSAALSCCWATRPQRPTTRGCWSSTTPATEKTAATPPTWPASTSARSARPTTASSRSPACGPQSGSTGRSTWPPTPRPAGCPRASATPAFGPSRSWPSALSTPPGRPASGSARWWPTAWTATTRASPRRWGRPRSPTCWPSSPAKAPGRRPTRCTPRRKPLGSWRGPAPTSPATGPRSSVASATATPRPGGRPTPVCPPRAGALAGGCGWWWRPPTRRGCRSFPPGTWSPTWLTPRAGGRVRGSRRPTWPRWCACTGCASGSSRATSRSRGSSAGPTSRSEVTGRSAGTGSWCAARSRFAGGPGSPSTRPNPHPPSRRLPPPRGPRGGRRPATKPSTCDVVVPWPQALRRVRGWLGPWVVLERCWRAWSTRPPPAQLGLLLDAVAAGRPLWFAPVPATIVNKLRLRDTLTSSAPARLGALHNPCPQSTSRRRAVGRLWDAPAMNKIGYARVSTRDQQPQAQLDALQRAGCARVFVDHGASGRLARRPELDRALDYLRPGDQLVITKLDRIGRSVRHLIELAGQLAARDVDLVVLHQAIDTTTPGGRLFFHLLAAFAEFEADLASERTRDGLEAARARGRAGGRRPARGPRQPALARQMYGTREHTVQAVAETLGVTRSTIYRSVARASAAAATKKELSL